MIQNQIKEIPITCIEHDFLIYSLNKTKMTASVTGFNSNIIQKVIIPRSISYKSKEYIVTSINSKAFADSQIKSIDFAPNSTSSSYL